MNPTRFYLTTPLYYVNARPHIGHAYTTIAADCFARWHRQQGEEVFLLTGTDEHGEKIAQAAAQAGLIPQAFVDKNSQTFASLWKGLQVSYDQFIRTTDAEHVAVVQKVLERLKPQLELGTYTFWYCVPCETHFGLGEIPSAKPVCPNCRRPVEKIEEEDYFLPLENHREWLKNEIQGRPDFIRPTARRNEVLGMLEKPLHPLCITRPKARVPWGIEVPFSPSHVTYVWFDALLNYVSALGYPEGEKFKRYWRETRAIHLIGKDILRHHAVYWPIILHALGVEPPRTIFAHGWWLVKGEKMSKSLGNIVDPEAVVSTYGLDVVRYFLLRDVPLGEDGVFSEEALRKRLSDDLANDLGNLVYRTLSMLERHTGGKIPTPPSTIDPKLAQEIMKTQTDMVIAMSQFCPSEALSSLWEFVRWANQSIEKGAPWALARQNKMQELEWFLYRTAEALRVIAIFLWPFLPSSAQSIWRQLGFSSDLSKEQLPLKLETLHTIPAGQVVRKEKPLFPKLA